MARAAVARVAKGEALALQLGLFEAPVAAPVAEAAPGPRKRGPNKAKAGLAELLDAHGMRDPGLRLAVMAGLDTPVDPLMLAIGRAEVIQASAGGKLGVKAFGDLVVRLMAEARHAAEALLPYRHGKITPDVADNRVQTIIQIAGPGSAPGVVAGAGRVGPPPMPGQAEIVADQGLGRGDLGQSDGE